MLEFANRTHEYEAVTTLCGNIQSSPDACPYTENLNKLLDCSESFKTRWMELRNKCCITRSFIENRTAILEEWKKDVDTLTKWIEDGHEKLSGNSSFLSSTVSFFVIRHYKHYYFLRSNNCSKTYLRMAFGERQLVGCRALATSAKEN